MRLNRTLLIIISIILGLFVWSLDTLSGIIYFIVVPAQLYLFSLSYKTNNFYLIVLLLFFLFSVGGSSVTLFLTREQRPDSGMGNVGSFDFSILSFLDVYLRVFIFFLFLIIFIRVLDKNKSLNLTMSFIKQEIKKLTSFKSTYSLFPLVFLSIFFACISIWMYNNHVGILGLKNQNNLPFHLTGVLYYLRRLVFTIILLFVFIKTKNKIYAFYILITYSFVVSVSASSKSINLMILVPVGLYFILVGKKLIGGLSIIVSVFIYAYVMGARELIFSSDGNAPLFDVFTTANEFTILILNDKDLLSSVIGSFFHSLYGMDTIVTAYQYTSIGIGEFSSYYTGTHICVVIPDIVFRIMGYELPSDKAYGICIGNPGTVVMMSFRNYYFLILESLILAIVVVINNKSLYKILSLNNKRIIKYICLGISLGIFYSVITANTMLDIYILTFAMVIIEKFTSVKRKMSFA